MKQVRKVQDFHASKVIAIGDREAGEMMGKPNCDLSPNTKYFSTQVTEGMCGAYFQHFRYVTKPGEAVYRPLK